MFTLEIVASTVASCQAAEKGGAHRIELCSALKTAGISPSAGLLREVKRQVGIPVFVLLRPREGDFIYSEQELEVIHQDIITCKNEGADGIVAGVLNLSNEVNPEAIRRIVEWSYPLPVTFHRAFDVTPDLFAALETIIDSGCTRILTSGGAPTSPQGKEKLFALAEKAKGRIGIMPGGGITTDTIQEIFNPLISEYHMSARSPVKSPVKAGIFETDYEETDVAKVELVCSMARAFFSGIEQ
jgi:copper homeostasis protein